MATFTSLSEHDVRELLSSYRKLGELKSMCAIMAGSVNSNFSLELITNRYFLRIYEEQDYAGASSEFALLERIASLGVVTPVAILKDDGGPIFQSPSIALGKPVAIFPWCNGDMRCQKGVTSADVVRVGEQLARIHIAGEGMDTLGASRFEPSDLVGRIDRIALSSNQDLACRGDWLREKLGYWLERRHAKLPEGLVHGDLFRDNVLWHQDGRISALLDFESASRGRFAYDLAVTMLAWCVGDSLDMALCRSMVEGYQSVRTLTTDEKEGLLAEACIAALRFTITRITDYAMRSGIGPRVMKDWRRFAFRLSVLESLGEKGMAELF